MTKKQDQSDPKHISNRIKTALHPIIYIAQLCPKMNNCGIARFKFFILVASNIQISHIPITTTLYPFKLKAS